MTHEILLSRSSSHTNLCVPNQTNELGCNAIWKVIPATTPKIIRKCSRCDRDRFYSSDKFRINANKKLIDIWLIYKCVHCDSTLNLPIMSRTPITKIGGQLLSLFESNNTQLCWQHAFDSGFFQKGIKIDWDIDIVIEEQILNNPIAFESLVKFRILIQSEYNLKIPIFSILRAKMQISRSQLEKLQKEKRIGIYTLNGTTLDLKAHLGVGCILEQ